MMFFIRSMFFFLLTKIKRKKTGIDDKQNPFNYPLS